MKRASSSRPTRCGSRSIETSEAASAPKAAPTTAVRCPARAGSLPRIKLDLTVDELVVLPPVDHPYTDAPEAGIAARCYAYEEIFAEKVKALGERTRPRDLYDVVNLFRNLEFRPTPGVVREVLRRKCAFKQIEVPTFASLQGATSELVADWPQMLGHQLPVLPPFETFWNALPDFFQWLGRARIPAAPVAARLGRGETVFRPAVGSLRRQGLRGSGFLESARFAAANRLCVDLGYQGSVRRIEPYSLRRTMAGDVLLFGVRLSARAFYRDPRFLDRGIISARKRPSWGESVGGVAGILR